MHGVLSIASTCVCTLGGTTAVQGSVSVGADAVLSVEDHVVTGKDSLLLCDGVLSVESGATLTANGKLRAVRPHSGVKGTLVVGGRSGEI